MELSKWKIIVFIRALINGLSFEFRLESLFLFCVERIYFQCFVFTPIFSVLVRFSQIWTKHGHMFERRENDDALFIFHRELINMRFVDVMILGCCD